MVSEEKLQSLIFAKNKYSRKLPERFCTLSNKFVQPNCLEKLVKFWVDFAIHNILKGGTVTGMVIRR